MSKILLEKRIMELLEENTNLRLELEMKEREIRNLQFHCQLMEIGMNKMQQIARRH